MSRCSGRHNVTGSDAVGLKRRESTVLHNREDVENAGANRGPTGAAGKAQEVELLCGNSDG